MLRLVSVAVLGCFACCWLCSSCLSLAMLFCLLLALLFCLLLAVLFLPAVGCALLPAVGFALLPAVGCALLACRWLCSSACCWLCSSACCWLCSSACCWLCSCFDVLLAVLVPVFSGSVSDPLQRHFVVDYSFLDVLPPPPTPLLSIAPFVIAGSRQVLELFGRVVYNNVFC